MKVTNLYNLPEPLVKAVSYDIHPRSGFSVTDLIQSPRITQLMRRHWDEIEVDVSERIWALLGSSIHVVLEKGELPNSLKEHPLKAKVNGTDIAGRPDLWYEGVLTDWKITSVWNIIFEPDGRKEYHAQLNIYKWLYEINGLDCNSLEICAILRDWQQSKVVDHDYPKIPVVVIPIPIWDKATAEKYIFERVKLHTEAKDLPDDELPPCSDEEMWAKPTKYALMHENKKSAVALFNTEDEAQDRLSRIIEGRGYYIQERPGKRARCEGYCDVNSFCSQFREYKEAK